MGESQPNRLPAPAAAHQRAPTLMASANAGGQGQVTVWAPSRLRLWGNLLLPAFWLFFLPWVASHAFVRHDFTGASAFACWAVVALKAMKNAYRSWRRPCYLTTDDAGLGVTTRKGSRAIHWADVGGLRTVDSRIYIQIVGGGRKGEIPIDLSGYPRKTRDLIRERIVERARLRLDPYRPGDYVCAGLTPPLTGPLLHSTLTIIRRKPPLLPRRRIPPEDESRPD